MFLDIRQVKWTILKQKINGLKSKKLELPMNHVIQIQDKRYKKAPKNKSPELLVLYGVPRFYIAG